MAPSSLRLGCANLMESLVGVDGFEPPTSSSQSWRTTRLCYTPRVAQATASTREVQGATIVGRWSCARAVEAVRKWLAFPQGKRRTLHCDKRGKPIRHGILIVASSPPRDSSRRCDAGGAELRPRAQLVRIADPFPDVSRNVRSHGFALALHQMDLRFECSSR